VVRLALSRRPLFFLAIVFACLLLYEPTPAKFRWVNVAMAALAFFWFVLLAAEEVATSRRNERHRDRGGSR
jgi:hypothetical protein